MDERAKDLRLELFREKLFERFGRQEIDELWVESARKADETRRRKNENLGD